METEDLIHYNELRIRVEQEVLARPRGAQSEMSYDLRVPATLVNQVIHGKRIDAALLGQIDEWLAVHSDGEVKS